jgi:hypothetical protein
MHKIADQANATMNMSAEIEIVDWIKQALRRVGSNAKSIPTSEANRIVRNARKKFVNGNPRAWWMSLKAEPTTYCSETTKLKEILPPQNAGYWFVPEMETDELPVFELSSGEIQTVLNESPYFEYYILPKDYAWLIAESDHNQFYVVKK